MPVTKSAGNSASAESADSQISASDESANPQYVSRAEFDECMNQVKNQSRIIGRYESILKKTEQAEKTAPKTEDVTLVEMQRKMDDMVKTQKAKTAKLALREALGAEGVNPDFVEDYADFLAHKFSDSIHVDETNDKVMFREAEDKHAPLREWTKAYVHTYGRAWLTPKAAPVDKTSSRSSGSSGAGEDGFIRISADEYRKNPGAYAKAMAQGKVKFED